MPATFQVTVSADVVLTSDDVGEILISLTRELKGQGFSSAQLTSGGLAAWIDFVAADLRDGGTDIAQHPTFYGRVGVAVAEGPSEYVRDFTAAYWSCAFWTGVHREDGELDHDFDVDDLNTSTREEGDGDCLDFVRANWSDLSSHQLTAGGAGGAGHDFWLTRNRHGAGFWDGDYPNDVGTRLTDAAHVYGEVDLSVDAEGNVS